KRILNLLTSGEDFQKIEINKILNGEKILEIKKEVKKVKIDEKLQDYILDIIFASREYSPYIAYGASPRGSIGITLAAKASAYLNGRDFVLPEDIKRVVYDVLRHRIAMTYEAEAEEKKIEEIIETILETVILP
ncbi:MAG: AAA family ATPase, partial [Fusobacteriaceae bacterium]